MTWPGFGTRLPSPSEETRICRITVVDHGIGAVEGARLRAIEPPARIVPLPVAPIDFVDAAEERSISLMRAIKSIRLVDVEQDEYIPRSGEFGS